MEYKTHQTDLGNVVILIFPDGKIMSIPDDPANTDYQQYLAWLEEGNIPEEWNPDQSSDTIEGDS